MQNNRTERTEMDEQDRVEEAKATSDPSVRMLSDINERGLKVVAFICEDVESKLTLIQYDNKGLVRFISQPVAGMQLNEPRGGAMYRPIAEIGGA